VVAATGGQLVNWTGGLCSWGMD